MVRWRVRSLSWCRVAMCPTVSALPAACAVNAAVNAAVVGDAAVHAVGASATAVCTAWVASFMHCCHRLCGASHAVHCCVCLPCLLMASASSSYPFLPWPILPCSAGAAVAGGGRGGSGLGGEMESGDGAGEMLVLLLPVLPELPLLCTAVTGCVVPCVLCVVAGAGLYLPARPTPSYPSLSFPVLHVQPWQGAAVVAMALGGRWRVATVLVRWHAHALISCPR